MSKIDKKAESINVEFTVRIPKTPQIQFATLPEALRAATTGDQIMIMFGEKEFALLTVAKEVNDDDEG